jgi:cytosine/adenosine deaminase-related metal-dependent hydrolase
MVENIIFSDLGLIGEDLEFKKNIRIKVNKKGEISEITYESIEYPLDIMSMSSKLMVIPGLINSHVHIGDNFAKEKGFNRDLREVVAPPSGIKHMLLETTPSEIKSIGIKKALEEMIHNGITCFVDFRERGLDGIKLLKKELEETPIYGIILGRFRNTEDLTSVYLEADGIGLVSYDIVNERVLKELEKSKVIKRKVIACHSAEEARNTKLINRMIEERIVDVIIHGTHLTEKDLEQINKNNIKLVICPRCNGYFGVGFPPIISILKKNLDISIGTDNLMANSPDLFEELRYLYRIIRILDKNIKIKAKSLIKMITINAAKNFTLEEKMGSIEQGKLANFFMVDLNDSNLFIPNLEKNEIFALLIQRVNPSNIKKVFIRGVRVYE